MLKIKKLRTRITAWMLGLAVLVTLVTGAVNLYGDYTDAYENVDRLIEAESIAYSQSLDQYLAGLEEQLVTLAVSGAVTSGSLTVEERQRNLNAILRSRPDLSALYTIGADGISVNDADYTGDDSSGEDYGGEEFFLTGMAADDIWVDVPSYDEWTDNITMTLTYRLRGEGGFDGLVCMDIQYDDLLAIVTQGKLGETGYSFLVDGAGTIVAHPDQQYVLDEVNYLSNPGAEPSFAAALATVVEPGAGTIPDVTLGGETVTLGYRTLDSNDWSLVTVAKPAEFLGKFYSSVWFSLAIIAVTILVAGAVSLVISRQIAGPISAMTERLRLFAGGDLSSPMPEVRSHDELGVLHASMSQSIETLGRYVGDISHHLRRIAQGDVTGRVSIDYAGDFAPIKADLNGILDKLGEVMTSIMSNADQVGFTSVQMSTAAQELSNNTLQQASTVDELSASFAGIKDSMQQTAGNTTVALQKTSAAKQALEISSTAMDDMLAAMGEISSATSAIEKIIKAIDDIAFQTNILALNAAVEAARAGQHGKGFAVVADEVRNLATKSADSAKQTAALIQNSLSAVKGGSQTAQQAWDQLASVSSLVGEVTGLVEEIESVAGAQAASAGQIYEGIEQLNSIVQTDSAMAEESAAASAEMSGQADSLRQALSFFTLREQSGGPAPHDADAGSYPPALGGDTKY